MASSPPSYQAYYQPLNPQHVPPNRSRNAQSQYQLPVSPEVTVYTEYTPLVQAPPSGRKKKLPVAYGPVTGLCLIVLVLIGTFSGMSVLIDRSLNHTLDPAIRDRIRQEWSIEERKHQRFMEHAREQEIQWKERTDEQNEKQEDWRRQEREWQREWNEMQRRAREEAERAEQEKWDREHMNLYWENIKGEENCTAYKTRKYSARLANLGSGIGALDACRATPLTIRDVTYDSPLYCEDRRSFGDGIYGHWVNNDEPLCSTFWEYFKIKDCLAPGSGLRRVETPLGNLRSVDNYEDMCYTTPAVLYGREYDGPTAGCVDWGKYGYWGIWNIRDESCI